MEKNYLGLIVLKQSIIILGVPFSFQMEECGIQKFRSEVDAFRQSVYIFFVLSSLLMFQLIVDSWCSLLLSN